MQTTALIRLPHLELIPPESVPKGMRDELKRLKRERRDALEEAGVDVVALFVSVSLCLAYGAGSILAWIGGGNPLFGIACSIFCALFVFTTVHMGKLLGKDCASFLKARPTPKLLQEAEAEQAIENTRLSFNAQALEWNRAAEIAEATDLDGRYVEKLRLQRDGLARRQVAFETELKRFQRATAPRPKALPPPEDWGTVVHLELKSP